MRQHRYRGGRWPPRSPGHRYLQKFRDSIPLSPYIRATRTRPLVVKLHGHHQFAPLNTNEETQQLDPQLGEGVKTLLQDRGLIFIGYSGQDEGIRDLLSQLPEDALPYGVYWVSGSEPRGLLGEWLREHDAFWVPHRDFDELMVHVRGVFEFPMPDRKRVIELFDAVQQDYVELSERIMDHPSNDPAAVALKAAAGRVDRTLEDWALVELQAQRYKKSNPTEAKKIYEQGLNQLPESVPLLNNYANHLKDMDHFDLADHTYRKAIDLDPSFPSVRHDYAIFLWRYQGDLDMAREQFKLVFASDEKVDAIRLSNYASFVWEVERQLDTAEQLMQRALSLQPVNPQPYRQYALFLTLVKFDYLGARELYEEALRRDPADPITLLNYSFLALLMGDVESAHKSIERAYAADEDDLFVIGALANFLWQQRVDLNRAEELFEKAQNTIPRYHQMQERSAGITMQYAHFLAAERDNLESAAALLNVVRQAPDEKGILIPHMANLMAHHLKQPEEAISLIDSTIATKGETGLLLGVRGDIEFRHRGDIKAAKQLYRRALDLDPSIVAQQLNLAALILATAESSQERIDALRMCLEVAKKVGRAFPDIAVESFFYLYLHGTTDLCEQRLGFLKWLVEDGVRSSEWDLKLNVDRAIADGHPQAEWLPTLAMVISAESDVSALSDWAEWSSAKLPELR